MSEEREPQPRTNVSFSGQISGGQFVVGDHNTAIQRLGLTPAEIQQLTATLAGFHAQVAEQAPPEVRDAALAQAGELEEAVKNGDVSRLKQAALWFARNAPRVGEAVASLVLTPIVGRLVGVAGDALVAELGLRPAPADDAGQRLPD
jgi:hypothetical protein